MFGLLGVFRRPEVVPSWWCMANTLFASMQQRRSTDPGLTITTTRVSVSSAGSSADGAGGGYGKASVPVGDRVVMTTPTEG
jgi:hypothetical protein